ncbi:Ldh family oxidoreductase, partial [Acetobacterium sp.]|uniref:Ldh family oxidoreductase n=1 Tax=Acetobacterium sp. TaxID=1872094 RepID=UPI002F3FD8D7
VSQRGKIEVYDRENKDIPDGWVIDRQGNSRTDTKQILIDLVKGEAALTPLGGIGEDTGGYKGYGYATFVEILSSALQSGAFLKGLLGFDKKGNAQPYHLGHFFIAINIDNFTEIDDFKKITGDIMRDLRASDKMPGQERIYTAGEKEYDVWLDRKDKGTPMNDALIKDILDIKAELGLEQYQFPFEK